MKHVVHIFHPVAWNHALNAVKTSTQRINKTNINLQLSKERISDQVKAIQEIKANSPRIKCNPLCLSISKSSIKSATLIQFCNKARIVQFEMTLYAQKVLRKRDQKARAIRAWFPYDRCVWSLVKKRTSDCSDTNDLMETILFLSAIVTTRMTPCCWDRKISISVVWVTASDRDF